MTSTPKPRPVFIAALRREIGETLLVLQLEGAIRVAGEIVAGRAILPVERAGGRHEKSARAAAYWAG